MVHHCFYYKFICHVILVFNFFRVQVLRELIYSLAWQFWSILGHWSFCFRVVQTCDFGDCCWNFKGWLLNSFDLIYFILLPHSAILGFNLKTVPSLLTFIMAFPLIKCFFPHMFVFTLWFIALSMCPWRCSLFLFGNLAWNNSEWNWILTVLFNWRLLALFQGVLPK